MERAAIIPHSSPCNELKSVKEFIEGNGKLGAKTRLALLEDNVGDMKATLNRIAGWVIGAMITLITGSLLWIFTSLIPKLLQG